MKVVGTCEKCHRHGVVRRGTRLCPECLEAMTPRPPKCCANCVWFAPRDKNALDQFGYCRFTPRPDPTINGEKIFVWGDMGKKCETHTHKEDSK